MSPVQNAARPQLYARLAGLLYLIVILFGGFAEGFVMNKLTVPGDAGATINNILSSPELWRLGLIANLVVPLVAVVQLWLEYLIFRPAGERLALLFVLLNLASLSVEAVSKVFMLMIQPAAIMTSNGASHDVAFGLARMWLTAQDLSFHVALIFFGSACLVSGWLIFRSGFLPKAIGLIFQLAGVSYLVASFAALFAPEFGVSLAPWIFIPVLAGEVSLCLWLLIRGVNVEAWRQAASAASRSAPSATVTNH